MDLMGLEIPDIEYRKFSEATHVKAVISNRRPLSMALEITGRCNVSCIHCYMPGTIGKSELNTEEIKHILDDLAEAGVLWLTITGGEPLVRKDFEEIYVYAKKKGFIITIFSNGILINERIADLLNEWPPFAVEITVHSLNEDIFEQISKAKGSYRKCMNGIKLLSDRGVSLRLKTVAMRQNKDDLESIHQFAKEIDAQFRYDPQIMPKIDAGREPLEGRLSAKELSHLESQIERVKAWKDLYERLGGDKSKPAADRVYKCGAGISGAYINAEGRLSACVATQHESYDLRSGSFEQGWSEFLHEAVFRKPSKKTKCDSCNISMLCGRCVGVSYLEEGDEETPVEFFCELGHLRKSLIDRLDINPD